MALDTAEKGELITVAVASVPSPACKGIGAKRHGIERGQTVAFLGEAHEHGTA
jgi:hypothetical protein